MVLFQHHHLEHKYILWLGYLHSMYDCATIGTSTDTISNLSSACIMLVYVVLAVRTFSLDLNVINRCYNHCSTAFKSLVLLNMTVTIASQMHSAA